MSYSLMTLGVPQNYSIPGALILLGIRNPEKGILNPHHSPYFDVDEDVLPIGTAVHVALVYEYLKPMKT